MRGDDRRGRAGVLLAFEAITVATAMPAVALALDGLMLCGLAFGASLAAEVLVPLLQSSPGAQGENVASIALAATLATSRITSPTSPGS